MSNQRTDANVLRDERDAIAFLGLLSHLYLSWDPPIQVQSSPPEVTHYCGLNIHALVIDNCDGEVLALERNYIHRDNSPVEHAEQLAIRAAIERVKVKRPRNASLTVEDYYRKHLFYADGVASADFVYKGCTLFSSLEPCPMCAATLCVCRMKRVVYLIPDAKYGGSWDGRSMPGGKGLKEVYYNSYDLQYGQFAPNGSASAVSVKAKQFYDDLIRKIVGLRNRKVPDTQFFDFLHPDLGEICAYFLSVEEPDWITTGDDRQINALTLSGLKQRCNLPVKGAVPSIDTRGG